MSKNKNTNMPDSRNSSRDILKLLFFEEWRLHKNLFNGNRFIFFPAVILAFTILASVSISAEFMSALDPSFLLFGVHIFVLLFGLQTGSIIFINNRDDAENLLGDITPFIYTAKLLPTSQSRFVQLFIVKDIVYYFFLILFPISVGLIPSFGIEVAPILVSLLGLFIFGIGLTILGVSLYYRYGAIAGLLTAIGVFGVFLIGQALAGSFFTFTPAGMFYTSEYQYIGTGVGWMLATILPVLGSELFESSRSRTQEVYSENTFESDVSVLGFTINDLTAKQLLDIKRSSGGFGKVVFSYIIILGLAIGMLEFISPLQTFISHSMFFAVIMSMGAFTTYTWINQSDSVQEYLIQPVTISDLINSKFYVFCILTILPISTIIIVSMIATMDIPTGVLSMVVMTSLTVYTYSITVAFAGFSPQEFLFDAKRFLGFSLATAIPIMPLLIISLFFPPMSYISLYVGTFVYSVVLGLIGYLILKKTPQIWERTLDVIA